MKKKSNWKPVAKESDKIFKPVDYILFAFAIILLGVYIWLN